MFPAALDVVRALRPKLVVFENVPGLTRPSFAPYFDYVKAQLPRPTVRPRDDEMWWEHANRISRTCTATPAYSVHQELVDAADLGVSQSRRRVALMQGFPLDYEFPGIRSRVTEIIGNAVAVPVARTIGSSLARMLHACSSAEDAA